MIALTAFFAALVPVVRAAPPCASLDDSVDPAYDSLRADCRSASDAIDALAKAKASGDADAVRQAEAQFQLKWDQFEHDYSNASPSQNPVPGARTETADLELARQALTAGHEDVAALPLGDPNATPLGRGLGPAQSFTGEARGETGPHDYANNYLTGAIAAEPAGPSRAAATAANLQIRSGQPAAAEKGLSDYLANHPGDGTALDLRAQARSAQGDAAGALADSRKALALNPNDQAARSMISQYEGQQRAQGRIGTGLKGLDFGAATEAGRSGRRGRRSPAGSRSAAGGPAR